MRHELFTELSRQIEEMKIDQGRYQSALDACYRVLKSEQEDILKDYVLGAGRHSCWSLRDKMVELSNPTT